ncbi:MAG: UvrD-helicase domain-containing protein [Anaplasma sp.]
MKNYKLDTQHANATDPEREFVWISASAGTGKTKLLVHRVIRLLMSGQRNILCLTFTNAAAHEIRERIYGIASEWLSLPEGLLAGKLQEVCYIKADPQSYRKARELFFHIPTLLKVQTVHGFCHSLISSFPVETGISADFGVREFEESYPRIFAQLLREDRSIDSDLAGISTELKTNTLYDLVHRIMSKQCKIAHIEPPTQTVSPEAVSCPTLLIDALAGGGIRDKKISTKLSAWNNSAKRSPEEVADYLKIFIDPQSLETKPLSGIVSKGVLEKFPEVAGIVALEQERLLEFAEQFYTERIMKRTFHLARIAQKCTQLYELDKKLSKYLDYNDVIRFALDLISHPDYKDWVLFCLDSKIDHVLVDESQDNSLEQWRIVAELCNEFFTGLGSRDNKRTLFVVGDVKQSIYGFQNARPDYFHIMYQYFAAKSNDACTVQLHKSFRSTEPILSLVDRVFNSLRKQVSFQEQEIRHETSRKSDYGYVEVWPLIRTEMHKKLYAWDAEIDVMARNPRNTDSQLLAKTISATISSWIQGERMLVAKNRPLTAGDILILVRHRSSFVDHMIHELKQAGIPVAGRDRFNIMDYIAVQDLVNLGEFLLLQENDVALAALLKSPIFELTDTDLLSIATSRTDSVSLWEKLQTFAPLSGVTSHLELLMAIAKRRSPSDLYCFVLSEHREKLLQHLGQASAGIIDEFADLLIKFGLSNHDTLESFIHWIKSTNPEVKIDINTSGDVVRIMTVHSAKGMQSPVVFLPDTTSVPKCELQIVFDEQNAPLWCSGDTNARCRDLKTHKRQEEYNEYLRLLYVAITRAEDELYIAGVGPSCGKSWYDIVTTNPEIFAKKTACLQPMFPSDVDVLCMETSQA